MQRPLVILGRPGPGGDMTGIRQLRRTQPLETATVAGLRVPTLAGAALVLTGVVAVLLGPRRGGERRSRFSE